MGDRVKHLLQNADLSVAESLDLLNKGAMASAELQETVAITRQCINDSLDLLRDLPDTGLPDQ